MTLESIPPTYEQSTMQQNQDALRALMQSRVHLSSDSTPSNTEGIDGDVRLVTGVTKKICGKIGGVWYCATLT